MGEGVPILKGSKHLRPFQGRSRVVEYPGVRRFAATPQLMSGIPSGWNELRSCLGIDG